MANITIDKARCKGCNICLSVCPKKVFVQGKKRNSYGTNMPEAEKADDCIVCRMCERFCPDGAIDVTATEGKTAPAAEVGTTKGADKAAAEAVAGEEK